MDGLIRVTGSIYAPGEPAVIFAQVLDAFGNPVNIAIVTLTLFRANGTTVVAGVNMPYIAGSNGIYQYSFIAPTTVERLIADVSSINPIAYGVEDFYVPQWTSVAPPIKVTGSIYSPGAAAVIYAQVLNAVGIPVNTATATLTLFRADSTIIIGPVIMPNIAGSNGLYQYQFTAPAAVSRLIADVSSVNPIAYGTEEFDVSLWAALRAHFKT
jgi:hypothetical protein